MNINDLLNNGLLEIGIVPPNNVFDAVASPQAFLANPSNRFHIPFPRFHHFWFNRNRLVTRFYNLIQIGPGIVQHQWNDLNGLAQAHFICQDATPGLSSWPFPGQHPLNSLGLVRSQLGNKVVMLDRNVFNWMEFWRSETNPLVESVVIDRCRFIFFLKLTK